MTLCHISAAPDLSQEKVEQLESYLKAVKLFRNYEDPSEDPVYSEVGTPSDFKKERKLDVKLTTMCFWCWRR